jgi:hypothetical protein
VKSHVILRMGAVRPVTPNGGGVWKAEHDTPYDEAEKRGWDPTSQAAGDGRRRHRRRGAVPRPGGSSCSGSTRQQQMGHRRPRARLRRRDRARLQRLDARLLRRASDRGCSAAAWWRHTTSASRVAEGAPLRPRARLQGDLPLARHRRTASPGTNRDYDPLWAECAALGVPICFHGGGQNFLKPDFSLEVLDKLMMWHTFSQPLGIMATLVSLTAAACSSAYPTLRAGLLEGNCSWAPWLLYRLDEHYEWLGGTRRRI